MSESKFKSGDFVEVTEDHTGYHGDRGPKKGSVWELDYYEPEEIEYEDDGVTVSNRYAAAWVGNSVDGMRYGHTLEEDKIKKVTEDIPFSIYAEVRLEVVATVYASSEAEAVKAAKSDYHALIQDFSEMSGSVVTAYRADA